KHRVRYLLFPPEMQEDDEVTAPADMLEHLGAIREARALLDNPDRDVALQGKNPCTGQRASEYLCSARSAVAGRCSLLESDEAGWRGHVLRRDGRGHGCSRDQRAQGR